MIPEPLMILKSWKELKDGFLLSPLTVINKPHQTISLIGLEERKLFPLASKNSTDGSDTSKSSQDLRQLELKSTLLNGDSLKDSFTSDSDSPEPLKNLPMTDMMNSSEKKPIISNKPSSGLLKMKSSLLKSISVKNLKNDHIYL